MEDVYKITNRRPTDEIESDDTSDPITKRVLLYGWDGVNKTRILVDSNGYLQVVPSDSAPITGNPIGLLISLTYS